MSEVVNDSTTAFNQLDWYEYDLDHDSSILHGRRRPDEEYRLEWYGRAKPPDLLSFRSCLYAVSPSFVEMILEEQFSGMAFHDMNFYLDGADVGYKVLQVLEEFEDAYFTHFDDYIAGNTKATGLVLVGADQQRQDVVMFPRHRGGITIFVKDRVRKAIRKRKLRGIHFRKSTDYHSVVLDPTILRK